MRSRVWAPECRCASCTTALAVTRLSVARSSNQTYENGERPERILRGVARDMGLTPAGFLREQAASPRLSCRCATVAGAGQASQDEVG